MNKFLDTSKEIYIYNLIKTKILTNLNIIDFDEIMNSLYKTINYICIRFAIRPNNYELFWNQLVQNNNRDILAIFNMLLPYIDDKEGSYIKHNQIYNLSDISLKIDPSNTEAFGDLSINNFAITNIQYNLYNGSKQPYTMDFFRQNFILLLMTIDRISNKLFVNWLNIKPLTLTNYKKSYLYEQSICLTGGSRRRGLITVKFPAVGTIAASKWNPTILFDQYFTSIDDRETGISETLLDNYNFIDINTDTNTYTNAYILNYNKMLKNRGISIGDVFNTIYYDLFYDIVKIKWLIYQDTFDDPNYDEIYIKKFNELIIISELYLNIKWDELEIESQKLFSSKWLAFMDIVLSSQGKFNRNGYFFLLKNIIFFMEKYYPKMDAISTNFNYIKMISLKELTNINDVEDDDDIETKDDEADANTNEYNINKITPEKLISNAKNIPHEDVYMYLLDTIQKFIPTWYGRNIVLDYDPSNILHWNYSKSGVKIDGLDNIKFNYDSYTINDPDNKYIDKNYFSNQNPPIILPETLTVKYKFFYNYAKSFVLKYDNDEFSERPNWYSMNISQRNLIMRMFNYTYIGATRSKDITVMSFIKYYKKTYYNSISTYHGIRLFDEGDPTNRSQPKIVDLAKYIGSIMYQYIRDKIIDITFESHIMKGLLGEFYIEPRLSDNSYLGASYEDKTRNQFNNLSRYVFDSDNLTNYKNNAFYFLTNSPYGELNDIYRGKKKNYFELIMSEYRWYSFYSMDWVSQINFFHRYINNRVIYVTGATGQGKSTQIPKLFLYGLKMIDRKLDGRIICSQPRVNPTRENTEQISWELGVPLSEMSINHKQKVKTFNPYIQYDSKDDSHKVEPYNGLLLKMVTDRLLYMEFQNSPFFKRVSETQNMNKTDDSIETNKYSRENLYDIIMVDESHEHNLNMDLILTVAKETVKYNNSLKLVIVSATMDDDEPIYRRYYKEIDDNFAYPYNFYNDNYNLNRISVDRRIHISPPGETTQHKVTEIYLDWEPIDYPQAEEEALKKTLELCYDPNSRGDILLFSLSTEDIKRICRYINSTLPATSDIICLPFFRELPVKWNIFSDLGKKVRLITTNREDLFDDIYPNISRIPRVVPPNTYKRVIIVATNIAEASITVNSLKYVIDTGYFISVSDNPYKMETNIDKKKIAEVSRIQRKGRVGRVGSGTVYYMYMKNSRKNIKSEFKICIENIYNELYDLAPNSHLDNPIMANYNWVDLINTIHTPKLIKTLKKRVPDIIDSQIFDNMIKHQYISQNKFNPSIINLVSKNIFSDTFTIDDFKTKLSNYNLNKDHTYDLITKRSQRLISGFDIKTSIYDPLGDFYIIHPDEKNIKRNILSGEIIQVVKNNFTTPLNTNHIISHKIKLYMDKCFNFNLFIDKQIQSVKLNIFIENLNLDFDNLSFQYDKTTLGRIIQKMIANFKLDESPYMNKSLLNTIIYGYLCDTDHVIIIMIALLNYSNYQLNNLCMNYRMFRILYGSNDLYIYYKLAQQIQLEIHKIEPKSIDVRTAIFEREKEQFLIQKKKIINDLKSKNNYWQLDTNISDFNKFNNMANQNKLNSKKNMSDYISETIKTINKDSAKAFESILNSISIDVDSNSAIKIMRFYIDVKNQIDKLKNINNIPNTTDDLAKLKKYIPIRKDTNEWTNVKKSFIYGFGLFQTVLYEPSNDSFYDINFPDKTFNISNDSISAKSDLMVYLFRNTIKNEISILIDTDCDTLVECNLFNYNPTQIDSMGTYNQDIGVDTIQKLIKIFNSIQASKYKYFNHLKTHIQLEQSSKLTNNGLLSQPNNLIEHLIKLWTSEPKLNLYNSNMFKYNHEQIGGSLNYKIKINKFKDIVQKINMDLILNVLDQNYNISIVNDYIYMNKR
jgi:hypothetical protein